MNLMSFNSQEHYAFKSKSGFTDCSSLGPEGFFEKKMNISLEALCNIFILWKEALTNFSNGNYNAHDALVGENACHIRAFALNQIALLDDSFIQVVLRLIGEINLIINSVNSIYISKDDTNDSVRNFLYKNNIIFIIPVKYLNNIKFITDSYLLTLTKEQLPSTGLTLCERTSYNPVRNWGLSYNRAQYLIHNTQKSLSFLSCLHVIKEARLLKNKSLTLLLQIKKDAHQRCFIPQFFTAKVLFLRALKQDRILLIKISRYLNNTFLDNLVLSFKPNAYKTDFELYSDLRKDNPCIMIEGVINYKDIPESYETYKTRLLSHSILEIILANFASHPQYSGELKYLPPPFDEVMEAVKNKGKAKNDIDCNLMNRIRYEKNNFAKYKDFAVEKGCCLENPALLFINHMYCEQTTKYVNGTVDDRIHNSPPKLTGSISYLTL